MSRNERSSDGNTQQIPAFRIKPIQRRLVHWALLVFAALGLAACGGGGDDGGGGGGGITYHYNVSSASFFSGGQQVATVRFGLNGSCATATAATTPITRVGAGTVNTPGSVSYSFTTTITPSFVESVYIDNNASGNLDSGDRVWGSNPNDLAGACFNGFDTTQTFSWDAVATGLFGGSIIYTGASNSFLTDPGSVSESMLDNAIIVDGDGYGGLKQR